MTLYSPREDSEMLAHEVQKYAKGIVLDVGTGTGIQAVAAAASSKVKKVYAVDINSAAIAFCKKNFKSNKRIIYKVSDLFSVFKKNRIMFDTIVFNPPYLPADNESKDISVIGGKKGYETIERFLNEANDFLAKDGIILLLFSSLTNKQMVDEIIERNLFEKELLHSVHLFYETLFVYIIRKNSLAKALSELPVKNLKFLGKGKRKIVYTGVYKNKKVAVKALLAGKKATSVELESFFLKKLNKHKIGPKLLFSRTNFLIAEFVDGTFLKDFFQKASKQQLKWVLNEIFKQCFVMDKLRINKDEMHHPWKHVLIKGRKVTMIDFERCRHTMQPKNVTQFCQFVANQSDFLNKKGFHFNCSEIMFHAQEYKNNPSKENFDAIIKLLENGH
ncbi:methyltransferase [Candidatus Woesearchaeota archaeon]|nr:methyltransferase [Candidatus Woesearchaeota archaeon]